MSTFFSMRAAAEAQSLPARSSEVRATVIHLRKVARKILHLGHSSQDQYPIWLGPLGTRLLWQNAWKWNGWAGQHSPTDGLRGGPVLSIDWRLEPVRFLSLESRLCSFRYVFANRQSQRSTIDELGDPNRQRQSLQAGLYLNVWLGELL